MSIVGDPSTLPDDPAVEFFSACVARPVRRDGTCNAKAVGPLPVSANQDTVGNLAERVPPPPVDTLERDVEVVAWTSV